MSGPVVPGMAPLTEPEFRNNWLMTLARLCRLHGDAKVAMWLGVSERHLRNLKGGASMPTADKIFNLLVHDRSSLDELLAGFHLKSVPQAAVCTVDPLTLDMIAVAHEVAKSESPDSPGGVTVTDHELLGKDEARLRRVARTLNHWVDRLDRIRGVVTIPFQGRAA